MSEPTDGSATKLNGKRSLHSPDEATGDSIAMLQRVNRLPVMYPRLQRICRPRSENFWVLGGRPGSFKTSLLWNLALNLTSRGRRALFVTLEMTPEEIALLAMAMFSGMERSRIEAHFALLQDDRVPFTPDEQHRWDEAVLRFQALEPVLRIHGAARHGRDIDAIIRSACRARFDAVFVDHLGMIGRESGGAELTLLGEAIHRLRGLSRGEAMDDYRPWVCATSQLNREIDKSRDNENEEERIPRLSDFRGSARIEHDADVAIALSKRRRSLGSEAATTVLDGFVLKNRNGPCPAVVIWDANGPTGLITERTASDDTAPPEAGRDAAPEPSP